MKIQKQEISAPLITFNSLIATIGFIFRFIIILNGYKNMHILIFRCGLTFVDGEKTCI